MTAAIDAKLTRVANRDRGRFERSYDPSTAEILDDFAKLQRKSPCRFADNAQLWGGPRWIETESTESNVRRLAPYLSTFAKAAPHEGLDGFVIGVPRSATGATMADLAKFFASVLVTLVTDRADASDLLHDEIFHIGWQFCFANLRMFVSVFSPIYMPTHPRHSSDSTYVFFQPEQSFTEHGIGVGGKASRELKESIRERFRAAGADYPDELIDQRLDAQLYILPRWPGDAECDWWRWLGSASTAARRQASLRT